MSRKNAIYTLFMTLFVFLFALSFILLYWIEEGHVVLIASVYAIAVVSLFGLALSLIIYFRYVKKDGKIIALSVSPFIPTFLSIYLAFDVIDDPDNSTLLLITLAMAIIAILLFAVLYKLGFYAKDSLDLSEM